MNKKVSFTRRVLAKIVWNVNKWLNIRKLKKADTAGERRHA